MTSSRARSILLIGLFLLALPLPAASQDPSPVRVPEGAAITLDGQLEDSEWEGALRLPLSTEGVVFLKNSGEFLALGVRGPDYGLAHVALAAGDTIWVLHASAALGSIVYTRDGSDWIKVQDPTWEVRDPTLTPEAVAVREAYLASHHWVGTTGRMGQENEREFLLRRSRFGGEELRLAVVYYPVGPHAAHPRWPESVQDGVVATELLTGPMPPRLDFQPQGWGRVR